MRLVWTIAIILLVFSVLELTFGENRVEPKQVKEADLQPCDNHYPYKQCEES